MLEPVAMDDVSKCGITDISGVQLNSSESAALKPWLKSLMWTLHHQTLQLLAVTPVGAGGKIQLTDAIYALMESETVEAFHMSGRSHDCGDKLGYLKAIVEYSQRHETLGDESTEYMKELVEV